jgi:hypothetical protein
VRLPSCPSSSLETCRWCDTVPESYAWQAACAVAG